MLSIDTDRASRTVAKDTLRIIVSSVCPSDADHRAKTTTQNTETAKIQNGTGTMQQ